MKHKNKHNILIFVNAVIVSYSLATLNYDLIVFSVLSIALAFAAFLVEKD